MREPSVTEARERLIREAEQYASVDPEVLYVYEAAIVRATVARCVEAVEALAIHSTEMLRQDAVDRDDALAAIRAVGEVAP